ncbi:MAG: hypothetical protein IJ415_00190 [Clostridia bacterium]|nr:hypothetical protein [Clostridia bacterium]
MEKENIEKQEILRVDIDGMTCAISTECWITTFSSAKCLNHMIEDVIYHHCSEILKSERRIDNRLAFLKNYLEWGFNHNKHLLILGEFTDKYYLEIIKEHNGEQVYFDEIEKEKGVRKLLEDADTWAYREIERLQRIHSV